MSVLVVLDVREILFGQADLWVRKNAMHEILAAALLGFGIMTVAPATVTNEAAREGKVPFNYGRDLAVAP